MKTYLEAYRERMEGINETMLEIAEQAKNLGFTVFAPKHGLIKFISIESDEKHIFFGFTEVPYRFYLSCHIDYTKGHGSGRTIKEVDTTENPFTIDEIVKSMQPNTKVISPSKNYLKQL